MYKTTIKDLNNKVIGEFEKTTIEEVNDYLSLIDSKQRPWHQPKEGEYTSLPIGTISHVEEIRNDEFGVNSVFYILPKHYKVETKNLSIDPEWLLAECYRKRQAEYPTLQEIAEALMEKFGENRSGKFDELHAKRISVKNKYLKP